MLAKKLPQTVMSNGLMQQRLHGIINVSMVRDNNSYLARLRIKEPLGMMHLTPAILHLHGLGHNLNVVKMQPLCQLPHSIRHVTALTSRKGLALLGRARLLTQHLHKRVVHFAQLIIRIGTIALTGNSVKKNQLAIQIKAQQNYLNKLKNQRYWMSEDFALLNNNVNSDSMLRIGSYFKVDDSYNSRGTYTEQQKSKAGVETSLAQTQMQIAQIKQSLSELSIQKEQSEEQFKERIDIAAHKLISQLKLWESNYVIKASTRGKVSLSGFWAENQYISSGQKFASIVPVSKTKIIGRVFVPSYGRGKVKIGQIVNIKLLKFPTCHFTGFRE